MRVPGQKFFVPANKNTIAGMARSYNYANRNWSYINVPAG